MCQRIAKSLVSADRGLYANWLYQEIINLGWHPFLRINHQGYYWREDYSDPWLVLSDLSPNQADVSWYQLRCWIECSYRDLKSDGFDWHKTRLRHSDRAERHWLAMSVAML